MTKKQEFKEKVEQVIQADSVTQIQLSHGRPLTPQERAGINNKIQSLQDDYGEKAGAAWNYLKRTIGVAKVDDLCLDHRDAATAIVDLLLDRARLKRAAAAVSNPAAETSILQKELAQARSRITELTNIEASLREQLKVASAARASVERAGIDATAKVTRLEVANRGLEAELDAAKIEVVDLAAKLRHEKQATYELARQAQDVSARRVVSLLAVVGIACGALFLITKLASQHPAPAVAAPTLCSIGAYSYGVGTIARLADAELTCKSAPTGLTWERKEKSVAKTVKPALHNKSKPAQTEVSEAAPGSIAWSLNSSEDH
jgi:hypothetical protein